MVSVSLDFCGNRHTEKSEKGSYPSRDMVGVTGGKEMELLQMERQAQGCYSDPKPHCHSDQSAWRQHGCSFQREVVWEPAIGDPRDCPSEPVLHPQRAAGPGTN